MQKYVAICPVDTQRWKINNCQRASQIGGFHGILRSLITMIKILFVCHGNATDSQEFMVLVGQNEANRDIGNNGNQGFTTSEGKKQRRLIFRS